MDRRTKYAKVKLQSPQGRQRVFDGVWEAIPRAVKGRCNVEILIELVKAMMAQRKRGIHHAKDEAVATGRLYHKKKAYRLVEHDDS